MGACASRPKDLKKGAPLPSEAPVSPRKPDLVDPALQEKKDEGETKKEEPPLVDVSEVAAPEATTKAEEAAAAEAVPVDKPAVEEKAAVKEEVVADKTQDKIEDESNVKL